MLYKVCYTEEKLDFPSGLVDELYCLMDYVCDHPLSGLDLKRSELGKAFVETANACLGIRSPRQPDRRLVKDSWNLLYQVPLLLLVWFTKRAEESS